jgi:hypothetical protein
MYRRPVFSALKIALPRSRFARILLRLYARRKFRNSEGSGKMLHVYTRHLIKSVHSGDAHWRRCHCPKWIRGVLLNGTKIRRSTQIGNWEAAEKLAREREAVETFLGDQKARGLGKETQKKYRGLRNH